MSDYFIQTKLNSLFSQSGESTSTLNFTVKNLTTKNYPASLKVNIHGAKIELLSAKDDFGDVKYTSNYLPSGINVIEIQFNRHMVGKNTLSHLNLIYKNPKAQRSENTWVVFFPKITTDSPGKFEYQLTIPKSYGRLIATEIMPEVENQSPEFDLYTLKGESLPVSSRIIFGESFPFSFTQSFSNTSRIELPKDTPSQKIYITNINPPPEKVYVDKSNWIAEYPDSQSSIEVEGYAVMFNSSDQLSAPNITKFIPHPYQYFPLKNISVEIVSPNFFLPFRQNQLLLKFSNPNPQAIYNVNINLTPHGLEILTPYQSLVNIIPPSGTMEIPIYINLGLNALFTEKSLQISTQNIHFSYNPPSDKLIFYYLSFSVLLSFVIIFTIRFTGHLRSLFVFRSKSKNHIRR